MKHKKLTSTERQLLSNWKKEGLSNKECAKRLGRHVSSIGRELKRNLFHDSVSGEYIYEPLNAQSQAESRKENAWKAKQPLKNKHIFSYVMEYLRGGWSPEQIAGRLREQEHKGDPHWQICMESIYQYIYKKDTKEKELWEYLRRKQKRRRKKGGRKAQRVQIPDRVSIHDRPEIVAQRSEFGHWEGDSVVGKGHRNGLHTEYERVSSLTKFAYMEHITAQEAVLAAQQIFTPLPDKAKRSTTLDNGKEHTNHKDFGLQVYFADPYSSYQRGGNENANLWIRYYFPKKTDFSTITQEELRDVEWELNNRPRKRLKFKTPQEVFDEYLLP